MLKKPKDTSWNSVAPWYNKIVGSEGHYYHEHTVIPGVIKLLDLHPEDSLVDLGCGQGVLSRNIPSISKYLGLDSAPALIAEARKKTTNQNYTFQIANLARPLTQVTRQFSNAVFVLSLQNMEDASQALKNASQYLLPKGKLVIVLNHPCFRIPRQSGWGVDEKTKQQYRWMNRYRSPLKVPINMNPGKDQSSITWSFHHSLQDYSAMLTAAGFVITGLEEWTSDKESVGKAAKMENRARSEFPLFLALTAHKTI